MHAHGVGPGGEGFRSGTGGAGRAPGGSGVRSLKAGGFRGEERRAGPRPRGQGREREEEAGARGDFNWRSL